MKQLRQEIWAALHQRDTWIMISIVAATSFLCGLIIAWPW